MDRRVVRVLLTAILLVLVAGVALAQRPGAVRQPSVLQQMTMVDLSTLTPALLLRDFEQALNARNVPTERRQAAIDRYKQLPPDLQQSLLSTADIRYAEALQRSDLYMARINPELLASLAAALFRINSLWPGQGAPGAWSYAFGNGFSDNCKVFFDGTQAESYYLDLSEFFPHSMALKVPAGATRDQMHQVKVRNMNTNAETAVVQYEIVAPRGYRGYHGWKFANFSRPTIDWKLYRHYFGAAAVEYANGTHRPAAQQWFDDAYTKAGSGGNCYGMSVSSLRVRNHEYDHMFHANYFTNPGTAQSWCWWYDWNDTTRETVQQQQGAWYTQEVLDVHTNLYNTQSARDIYNRCVSLVGQVTNRPVLVVWGDGWGHAVVPYLCQEDGNTRHIRVYDNNNPYRENETGSVDPNEATVNWSANTFAFGSAPKGVAMSYDECTPANPHLPGAEYGGPGSAAVVVAVSDNTQVQQITDNAGHRFFNPDGSVNEDPNTRIPFSMRMYPLVQRPPVLTLPQRPVLIEGLQLGLTVPPGPALFVFSQPPSSLNFTIAGDGAKRVSFFSAGRVLSTEAAGLGEIRLLGANALPAVQFPNPQQLGLQSVRFVRSREGGDRLFDLTGLRNLGNQALVLTPTEDGRALDLQAAMGAGLDLQVEGPGGPGARSVRYQNVMLGAGNAMTLSPSDWGELERTELKVQFRNLQTNQMLQQINVPPLR